MKKTVWTFGSLAAAVTSANIIINTIINKTYGMKAHTGLATVLAFALMIVSLSFIFFGVYSYRKNYGNGFISFGKAFKVGILIALMSCAAYVITWMIVYYGIMPDFLDQYSGLEIDKAVNSGASTEEIEKIKQQMEFFRKMYSNPITFIPMALMECLPFTLVCALLAALFFKKKEQRLES